MIFSGRGFFFDLFLRRLALLFRDLHFVTLIFFFVSLFSPQK